MFLQTFGTAIVDYNFAASPPPNIVYLAPNIGTFVLADNGTANFVWQKDEKIEFYCEKLAYKGIRTISNVKYYECEMLVETSISCKQMIKLLFGCKRASIDDGYRIFYQRPQDEDYQLWAWDAQTFKLHKKADR
ncbi:hypothetical protein PI95_006030 [Hassallia byssoidea VB512170]|uniref:Uncharacterized protein n=1 Tax=Hassallia byssoidea VB512170 TaxID=1304833 RepID=A0A846H441_9CYAN|nr:hypothetical protein [Hassalia byssoidea]NEU72142.1 hypothetical protein [Hassalia byssoidea VB512170]